MVDIDYKLLSDSIVTATTVSLSNEPDYQTKFNLDSVQIYMTCSYNTRNKLRSIILLDRFGTVLLRQTYLKYKKRVELNFYAEQNNLNYFVTLKPKPNVTVVSNNHDYLNWREDFDLCFIGKSQDVVDRANLSYRQILTGN